ncbi:MAG: hypothetical protein IJA52_03050 [Clostridia bacterium]|nr:hypothetical protein [Clostridia bacterium]
MEENNMLYHGSITPRINKICANSTLHGSDTKVVYLSDSFPYTLFYIWDSEQNIRQGKYVTAWIKDGIVFYEEQFKDQLRTFYKGVSGYVYCVDHDERFNPVHESESMWFSKNDSMVSKVKYIPDVYAEIMKYVNEGRVKVIYFEEVSEERIRHLYKRIKQKIIENELLNNSDTEDARFYQKFFSKAWRDAERS